MKKFPVAFGALFLLTNIATAQEAASTPAASTTTTSAPTPVASPSPSPTTAQAEQVTVTSQELDISREAIVPSLGATRYTIGPDRLDSQAQGENAPFNETILRFPVVARDSFGQLHVRGEHANLQYRIDDVLLPESIPGFGPELATRFADNISLITGALPAQFGFRETGVIDIHTKNGAAFIGSEASIYVGSFDTLMESLERGGVTGKLSYYVTQSYLHDGIGIENPTRSSSPIHDDTDQFKEFGYLSYIIDDTSRFTLLAGDEHTIRDGFIFTEQYATVDTVTLVFPVDANGNQTSTTPRRIVDNHDKYGYFYGFYLQDEWKPLDQVTINFGGRLDFVNAFSDENQFSPRISVVYKPWDSTALHVGYARYFTPPPLEAVPQSTIAKFAGTTNQSAITKDSPISSERAHYFDIGATQKIMEGWNVGIDGFYKSSHSTLDEGQFGEVLIQSSFNYKRGRIYGGEFTTNYDHGPFSAYGNVGWEWARGVHWSSSQFLFDPAEYAFVNKHWVFLDHDQRWTSTVGAAYTWNDWKVSSDFLYGSGLRRGFANTKSVPDYGTVNLALQRTLKIPKVRGSFKIRFDIVNLFDEVYELRSGSGIGVGAPQFGQRRGFYGTVAYDF